MVRSALSPVNYSAKLGKVVSSIIAAWSDVSNAFSHSAPAVSTGISVNTLQDLVGTVRGLNIGYFWMLLNCIASAAYVGRHRVKP